MWGVGCELCGGGSGGGGGVSPARPMLAFAGIPYSWRAQWYVVTLWDIWSPALSQGGWGDAGRPLLLFAPGHPR